MIVVTDIQPTANLGGFLFRDEISGASYSKHQHETHMLRLQVRGATINEWTKGIRSGRELLEPGSLALIPAGENHSSCSNAPHGENESAQLVMLLPESFLQTVADSTFSSPNVSLRERRVFRDEPLAQLLLTLQASYLEDGPQSLFNDTLSNSIAVRLVGKYATGLLPELKHRGGIARRQLKQVIEQIESSLDDNLSLNVLAGTASMSTFHFLRAFKETMGVTPHQYVRARKIERAKLLLRNPELTMSEISLSVGFSRQNHFSRVFRALTGLTPTTFRRDI